MADEMADVIVTLSLVIGLLWLLTTRCTGRLADTALPLREMLRLIYGGEARSVADALHRVTRRFGLE